MPPHALDFRTQWGEEDGPGQHADEVEVSRRFCRENDTSRRPKVEDGIGRDTMTWMRVVDDDIQSFVIRPIDQLQALINVSVPTYKVIHIASICCNFSFGSDETMGNIVNELELFVFTVEFETNRVRVHDSTGDIRNREGAISLS